MRTTRARRVLAAATAVLVAAGCAATVDPERAHPAIPLQQTVVPATMPPPIDPQVPDTTPPADPFDATPPEATREDAWSITQPSESEPPVSPDDTTIVPPDAAPPTTAGASATAAARQGDGADDASNYAFYRTNKDGTPIRWNPCQPIHYVINPSGSPSTMSPDDALAEIHQAVRQVSAASGLDFVFDGMTDEQASIGRGGTDPRYPHRFSPVLIAYGELGPGVDGLAQMRWSAPDRVHNVSYSGWIIVRSNTAFAPGFSSHLSHGRTLLHELGHVVGLNHPARTGPIMRDAVDGVVDYTTADRAGLARVGKPAGCTAPVAPPP